MEDLQICSTQDLRLNLDSGQSWIIFRKNNSSYLLCSQMVHYASKTLLLSDSKNQYICGLIKFVNLEYLSKLKRLFGSVSTKNHLNFPKQWLCLYQISSYYPQRKKRYHIEELAYGLDVILKVDKHYQSTIVSNCYGLKGSYFYFLQDISFTKKDKTIGLILNSTDQIIYGFTFLCCGQFICIPIDLIVTGLTPPLKIQNQTLANLKKTVYLEFRGSHCTGTLIAQNIILTVRHIFDVKTPLIGSQINLKIYPYSQTIKAKLAKIYTQQIDLVLFEIVQSKIALQPKPTSTQNQQIQYQIDNNSSKLSLGEDIKAIGFGRFDYSLYKLSQVDVILPTISRGIVSKIIYAGKFPILFKTDASLHHGFSGCGVWSKKIQKGVAAFIIKNTTNSNELTKQNFSYLISFIASSLFKHNEGIIQSSLETIKNIGKFGVRTQMKILPSL